jgi:hypothetical protein
MTSDELIAMIERKLKQYGLFAKSVCVRALYKES